MLTTSFSDAFLKKKGTLKLRCGGITRLLDKTMLLFDKRSCDSGLFMV